MNARAMPRSHGFTLVELMVGVALTMIIALALMALMANVSRNNAEMSRSNSVIENGRMALQLIEADVSHGGFWGGYVPKFEDLTIATAPGDFPTAVPDPCLVDPATTTWAQPAAWDTVDAQYKNQLITIPVQVYSYTSGTSPVCAGTSGNKGPLWSNVKPNTDILVVRHAAPCEASASATESDCKVAAGNVYFQFSRCPSVDATTWKLATSSTTDPASDLGLHKGTCGTNFAGAYRYVSTIYWVRQCSTLNADGTCADSIPTLMRTRYKLDSGALSHTGSEALIDGIEAFRVQLGVDSVSKPVTSGGAGNTLTATSYTSAPCFDSTCSTSYSNTYTPRNRGDGNADKFIVCANPASSSDVCYDATSAATLQQSAFNLANTVAVRMYVLARAQSATPNHTDNKVYCLTGNCTLTTSNKTSCTGSGTNDNLTVYGPYCDGYKRHTYTQTVRLTNVSQRREVPNSW